MDIRKIWQAIVRFVTVVWWSFIVVLRALYACRAPMIALLVGGGLIAFTDQARDMVLAGIAPATPLRSKLWFLAVVLFWAAMSWLWSRNALAAGFQARTLPAPAATNWQRFWINLVCTHVPRLIGLFGILSVALAFQSAYAVYRDAIPANVEHPAYRAARDAADTYKEYAWAIVVLGVGFYLVLVLRKFLSDVVARRAARGVGRAGSINSLFGGLEWVILLVSLAASPICFAWFVYDPVGAAAFFGNSVNVVLFGLAILTPALSGLALLSQRQGLPLFGTVLILTAIVPELTHDHHDVRLCEPDGNSAKCADPGYPAAPRPELHAAFLKWWDFNTRPDMFAPLEAGFPGGWRTPPLVVVATAGGASRAAFWTSLVLGEIAAREERFADRLFVISGVSGGSLGATLFRSVVEEDRLRNKPDGSLRLTTAPTQAESFMKHDFLGPALGAGLYVDLPLGAVSFLTSRGRPDDRAAALEKAWEQAWIDSASAAGPRLFRWDDGFLKIFGQGEKVWPILALNGTSVVKGKRTITSNADFQVSDKTNPKRPDLDATMSQHEGRYETFRFLNSDIRVSTAVTMSARFPVVSPTGGLRDRGGTMYGRVTDGGLFENFGAMTADEILRHLGSRIREAQWWRRDEDRKPVLPLVIVISSDPSLDPILTAEFPARTKTIPDCDPVKGKKALVENQGNRHLECPTQLLEHSSVMTDPLRALYSGRVERGDSAVAALYDRAKDAIRYTYEELNDKIDEKRRSDKKPPDGYYLVKGHFGEIKDVPFFHFRQCRVEGRKGPTMSWHDSPDAWSAMRNMTGLYPPTSADGARLAGPAVNSDPCGNHAEFHRLCVRLTMMVGPFDLATGTRVRLADVNEAMRQVTAECDRKWPKP